MRLSTVGRYALRAMVDLALHDGQGPVLCDEIAARQEVSAQYLARLFLQAKRAGLIRSVRGPGGGYVLARKATQIRAGEVLLAVDEILDPVFCVDQGQESACHRADGCPTRWLWMHLGQAIHEVVDSVTLADLCEHSYGPPWRSDEKPAKTEAETKRPQLSLEQLPAVLDWQESSNAFQQSVLDGIAEPIMVIGTNYRVQLMNRAAREFSSGEDLLSPSLLCYQISHRRKTPCDGVAHPCPLERVRESGQPVTAVHRHQRANGEWRFVELIATPLWQDDTFQGIVESMRDITERVRAEEELRAAHAFQQRLIDEERERIARELHDGMAQLLGYVNTKAMAVRLMLKNSQTEAAEHHLLQLEEAARELFVQAREAIFDLKTMGHDGASLATALKEYVAQFCRLSGLPVSVVLTPESEGLSLTPESELQLLRIVQESLTNIRKHASANKAWVKLGIDAGILELTVRDDGQGFNPSCVRTSCWPHFGLSTMRERAEAIGAEFDLDSEPGAGTLIRVRLDVSDRVQAIPEGRSATGVEGEMYYACLGS